MQYYCKSLTNYKRYKTIEVKIGDIPLGANNPIRIQSMTTTDTMDTIATVEQTIRMVEAGCEYVRITAPSIKEANNLAEIKKELLKRGYKVPLIADIHYTPNAAEAAARIVEKVRVNPGNYIDKKKFLQLEYTDLEYAEEIERIRTRFTPLVKICKEYGTAMRIGTNHGSLSDRIMSRYGDTPYGMVESALEFVRICRDENFHNIVLSMKSSNPQVMVQAYRLLIAKMEEEGMNYPLHLGVTEAGDGEDGRIKSALGIGSLLEDGIGDTIRVSLTEPPENESPVAINLAKRYLNRNSHNPIPEIQKYFINPFEFKKRETFDILSIGLQNVPKVVADFSNLNLIKIDDLDNIGYSYDSQTDKWNISDQAADLIYLGNNSINFELPNTLKPIYNYSKWNDLPEKTSSFPYYNLFDYLNASKKSFVANFVEISINELDKIKNKILDDTVIIVLITENTHGLAEHRYCFNYLIESQIKNPVIIKRKYTDLSTEQQMLYASTDMGGLLIDGLGDGVWLDTVGKHNIEFINRIQFGILQAARARISKTEYIACPSCGRTLFDLVEVTNAIREKTGHLKGVKIAVMGCIVNGPGEMADADYGYVGSGIGKITLYRGKEVVKKSIDSEFAVESLIDLIKEDNLWIEKK
ncbi:MAG TPA: (E)-4-hydroxy-3-methylbut-2-enyl-diphosphate synthase [Melioribacteraceae bacterium]|nr:(E)-4-hydroxy-3-methylbut-2-enyl-diphosphate synthase [Melioribacteraceae bacterium]